MNRILRTIFVNFPEFARDEAINWHHRLYKVAAMVIVYGLIVLALNLGGGLGQFINLILLFVVNGMALFFLYHPDTMIALIVADIGEKVFIREDSKQLEAFNKIVAKLLLLISFYTFVAATMSFRNHPTSVFILAAGGVCLLWIDRVYKMNMKYYVITVKAYTIIMMVLAAILFIPQTTWDRIGFDPIKSFRSNEAEKKLSKLADTASENRVKKLSGQLDALIKKSETSKADLTPEDLAAVEAIKKEIAEIRSQRKVIVGTGVVGEIKEWWDKKDPAPEPIETPPKNVPRILKHGGNVFHLKTGVMTEWIDTPGSKATYQFQSDENDWYIEWSNGEIVDFSQGDELSEKVYKEKFRMGSYKDLDVVITKK